MSTPAHQIVVASFNCHAGVDGWGRTFDLVAACRVLDADVILLAEDWVPQSGVGLGASVAEALDYSIITQTLTTGRRALSDPRATSTWKRPGDWRGFNHSLYLDGERPLPSRVLASARFQEAQPGSWGLAMLSRLPIRASQVIALGRLRQDRARRKAIVAHLELADRVLAVAGTHMSHILYGSPLQFAKLRHALNESLGDEPSVLGGDMNLWRPPLTALMDAWHRAVHGKTWPAWRPHSQVDHLLIRGAIRSEHGEVMADMGSDHRAIRAVLQLS
jgi:endonuclease/exonuclease/phosphatase family metal-dependent hydrolase